GLDHHDGDVFRTVVLLDDATGDHQVEHGLFDLSLVRERDPLVGVLALAGDQREADTGDRARERQTGDLRGGGCGVDRQRVVVLARGDRQHGDYDLDLVAQAVDERRTQRTVDQTAHQDRFGGGASLTTEERAGDLARGVGPLLDVDRQREEVEALTRVLARAGGRQDHGLFVEVGGDSALRLLGEAAGLEADGAGSEASVVEDGFGGSDFRTFQEVSPSLFRLARPYDGRVLAKERMRADIGARALPRMSPALATSRRPPGAVRDEEPTTGDQLLSRPLRTTSI